MESKIFLEFLKLQNTGKVIFEYDGWVNKKSIEKSNSIKNGAVYDCNGHKMGDYSEGEAAYCYIEGTSYEWYGKWCASADDLSIQEAASILSCTDDTDYAYVKWANEVLWGGKCWRI